MDMLSSMQTSGHTGSKLVNSEAIDNFQMMAKYFYILKEKPPFKKIKIKIIFHSLKTAEKEKASGKVHPW